MNKPTLADAIRDAAREPDIFRRDEKVREVIDFMRFHLVYTAAQCRDAAVQSGVEAQAWDDLVDEMDFRHS